VAELEECISDRENTCGDYQPGIHQKAVPDAEAQPDVKEQTTATKKFVRAIMGRPWMKLLVVNGIRMRITTSEQPIAVLIRKSGMSAVALFGLVDPSIIFASIP